MHSENLNYSNLVAEKQLVAWMAVKREYIDVPTEYFHNTALADIYASFRTQYFEHGEFIPDAIPAELMYPLSDAMEIGTPAKPDTIVRELKKAYMVRRFYEVFYETDRNLTIDKNLITGELGAISRHATEMLTEIEEAQEYDHKRAVFNYMLKIEEAKKSKREIRGYKSHLPDLDRVISGWERGKVYLISGLEKLGKSRLVRDLTSYWLRQNLGVAIFMLEEDDEAIHECILANRASVNSDIICTNQITEHKLRDVLQAANKYMAEPLYICNKSGVTPGFIRNAILRQKIKMKNAGSDLVFVVIDYIQRMTEEGDSMHEKTESIASELANIARDENVCLIEISQMSAGAEKTKGLPLHTQIRFGKVFKEAASCIITLDDPERRSVKDGSDDFAPTDHKKILASIIQRKGVSDICIPLRAMLQYSRFENYVNA